MSNGPGLRLLLYSSVDMQLHQHVLPSRGVMRLHLTTCVTYPVPRVVVGLF